MKSKLSTHIRRTGANSIFVRTAPGRFYLRELLDPTTEPYNSKPLLPPTSVEKVLVYRRDQLDHLINWLGINTDWEPVAQKVFDTLVPKYFSAFFQLKRTTIILRSLPIFL